MIVIHTLAQLRRHLQAFKRPAFVPTMGNLHDGHLRLVEKAKTLGDVSVTSIFVNRLQFLPHEDFDAYPRSLAQDCAQLEAIGCDVVFAPSENDLYPEPQSFKVSPPAELADILEGQFRPGFFTGVCTVVLKLFHAVLGQSGGVAVFGKKDYQQLMVIRRMVAQLAMPIEVVGVDTCRAADGLALSSRNGYLEPAQREQAIELHQALQGLIDTYKLGFEPDGIDYSAMEKEAINRLNKRGWQTDYLTIRRQHDLQLPKPQDGLGQLVALGAARIGTTRLIDNLEF